MAADPSDGSTSGRSASSTASTAMTTTSTADPPESTTEPDSGTTSETTAEESATTPAPAPARIGPEDTVIVDCGSPTLDVMVAGFDESTGQEWHEVVYSVDLDASLEAIGLSRAGESCNFRSRFNQDFSRYLVSSRGHVVAIDLPTGRAIDLTAPRLGTGFSGGSKPDEQAVGFLAVNDRWEFTNEVIIGIDGHYVTVDSDDPGEATPLPASYPAYYGILASPSGIDYDHSSTAMSPDGAFAFSDALGSRARLEFLHRESLEIDRDCGTSTRGWRDARHVVARSKEGPKLIAFDDSGAVLACEPILPPNDREIVDQRLRFDARALLLTVRGDGGLEYYSADLYALGSEPTQTGPHVEFESKWRIYHRALG